MRAVSVAKYQPPASSSARGPVGDHAPVGEQHRALGAGARRTRGRGWRRSPPAPRRARARSSARELGLGVAVHAARRLVEREHRRRLAVAGDDRERQPLALAAGQVARVALGQRRRARRGSSAARGRLVARRARAGSSRPGSAAAAPPARRARRARASARAGRRRGAAASTCPRRCGPSARRVSPGCDAQVDAAQDRRPVAQLVPDAAQLAAPARSRAPARAPRPARAAAARRGAGGARRLGRLGQQRRARAASRAPA